jgi:Domain of unknown function (DUF4468) with TBP-like fold
MKTILLLLLCICAFCSHAQVLDEDAVPRDSNTKLITYSSVVQMPGATQAELYARAKLWFVQAFSSAKDVIQADEKEAGIVQGTGWREISMKAGKGTVPLKLWYTVRVSVKEGRYKYEISGFQTQFFAASYNLHPDKSQAESTIWNEKATPEAREQYAEKVSTAGSSVTVALKAGMDKPAAGTSGGKSDW